MDAHVKRLLVQPKCLSVVIYKTKLEVIGRPYGFASNSTQIYLIRIELQIRTIADRAWSPAARKCSVLSSSPTS